MKLVLITMFMFTCSNVFAIELLAHKSSGSSIVKVDAASVEKAWASTTPSCLKDGSKLMGVNQAFRKAGLKYGDCSQSANAKEKQRMLGYEVAVFKLVELPDALAKQVVGKK